jgi:hypothetical protein
MPETLVSPRLQVGAPAPALETSPIVSEDDVDAEPNVSECGCSFNGVAFAIGDSVSSGIALLPCEAPGVWVRKGEVRPGSDVGNASTRSLHGSTDAG